ncbi:Cytochrome C biogenesis protein [gamma proteobacterium HdN1]|nr:Cytochrome C biogenesis protein [gamma proteobacterium HdN1]
MRANRLPVLLLSGVLAVVFLCKVGTLFASIDVYEFDQPDKEARFRVLTHELRCPKCQNQNINDSNAPLAKDMKDHVYQKINEGKSNQEIVDYLVERYGDFVTYRPRMSFGVALLWIAPALLGGLVLIVVWLARRPQQSAGLAATDRTQLDALLRQYPDESHSQERPASQGNLDPHGETESPKDSAPNSSSHRE